MTGRRPNRAAHGIGCLVTGDRPARIGSGSGRYRMLELLGRGGAASVYRARDESLGRDVAVKIFDESATSEKDIRRQQDEVNLLASLNHHSLVTLLDAGVDRAETERPRVYFVMELAAGADLKQKIEHGPLSPRHVAQIGYDVAEGVEYLHHKGVVHRDIKPANILLADYSIDGIRERAKLTDFGIALVRGNDRADTENFTTGTAAYLSPEQVRGQELDSASDIYSLGLVLLECFTGVTAFPGQPVASALARLQSDPSIPHRLDPEWSGLLAAMTAQDASDRPSIKEIVLALHQMIVAETGRHRAAGDFIKPNEVA